MSTANYGIQALRDKHLGMVKLENIREAFASNTLLSPTVKDINLLQEFLDDVLLKLKDTDLSALLARCFIEVPICNPNVLSFMNHCSDSEWTKFYDLVEYYGDSHHRNFEISEGEVNPKSPGESLFRAVLWLNDDEDFLDFEVDSATEMLETEAIAAPPLTMAKSAGAR